MIIQTNFTIDSCDTNDISLIVAKLNDCFANTGKHITDAFDQSTSSDIYLSFLGESS